ncbi:MAG: OsmC family protein [Armatimonadetes bacterium]|nr:OsmC family protein [Armatimonadota bacterium]
MRLVTDAPVDNMGKGESFSPSDLTATSLLTCILTTMGIVAGRHDIPLTGATGHVTKEMTSKGQRRIARLAVTIAVPQDLTEEQRQLMETTAHTCPVRKSLSEEIEVPMEFRWGPGAKAIIEGL